MPYLDLPDLGGLTSRKSFHIALTLIHSLGSWQTGLQCVPKMSQGLCSPGPLCLLIPLPITRFPDLQSWLLFSLESWLIVSIPVEASLSTLNCHHLPLFTLRGTLCYLLLIASQYLGPGQEKLEWKKEWRQSWEAPELKPGKTPGKQEKGGCQGGNDQT